MQQAHQSQQVLPEVGDFLLTSLIGGAEGQQIAVCIGPLTPDLVRQGHTLPKARICLVAAENNQEAKNECISSPYGLDAPSSANRLCHGVPQKHV